MTRPVAFFDFDGTLTRGDSLLAFLTYLKGRRALATALLRAAPTLAAYGLRMRGNHVAKETLLRYAIGGDEQAWLMARGADFAREVAPNLLHEQGLEQVRRRREQGFRCVLVSASLDLYLRPWTEAMGFEGCLCSSLAVDAQGRVSGRLAGKNCYGEEKVRRIREWGQAHPFATSVAYGDTKGDFPMLRDCDEGWLLRSGEFQAFP